MARGKIDTDKREDETAVYKPVKPKERRQSGSAEEEKPNAERPNAMSRNSSFPAGKSGKRRALPPSPETDGAPSAARAMRA
ncbi:MAG: hypothetical protein ACLS7Z_03090 [Christensenellales bacterium]